MRAYSWTGGGRYAQFYLNCKQPKWLFKTCSSVLLNFMANFNTTNLQETG